MIGVAPLLNKICLCNRWEAAFLPHTRRAGLRPGKKNSGRQAAASVGQKYGKLPPENIIAA